jgi:hypothetical protein
MADYAPLGDEYEVMVVLSDKIFAINFNLLLVTFAHAISATVRAETLIFWPQYLHSVGICMHPIGIHKNVQI